MKSLVATLVAVVVLALAGAALADPTPEDGCHGYYTLLAKELANDRGVQGSAIGGKGNSDGDPTDGQAHSEAGRGAILQEFLAANCGVGSETP
jgi:hypothetical protein